MNIAILDDYQDTVRTLVCFKKVAGHALRAGRWQAFPIDSRLRISA